MACSGFLATRYTQAMPELRDSEGLRRLDQAFNTVLCHHRTGQPGTVRHLPDGCGWVTDRSAANAPFPAPATEWHYVTLGLCLDCVSVLLTRQARHAAA
jgi:hypothetical protein